MTVTELLQQGTVILKNAGVPDADYDAYCLLSFAAGGIDRAFCLAHPDHQLSPEQEKHYLELCRKRAERIPLQHLTGTQGFYGLDFEVGPDVLIPRYDTEALVETVLEAVRPSDGGTFIDVGTGSGCILITLLHRLVKDGDWRGIGLDLSEAALETAGKNARKYSVEERIELIESDLFASVGGRKASVIVSNPPYIPTADIDGLMPEVRDHDPRMALDGGADGLDIYRRLIPEAYDHLLEGGLLAVEIGEAQTDAVRDLFERAGFQKIFVKKDLSGHDRVVAGSKISD